MLKISTSMIVGRILFITEKKDSKFLRQKTKPFDFNAHSKKEINNLIKIMREAMVKAGGIGLAANQIGFHHRIFVARVPGQDGRIKFYAIFNPIIDLMSSEITNLSEGCLSVPGIFGEVERARRITLTGFDKQGKLIKMKAWGLLAHVFQHEVDHLDGKLFIDKAKRTYNVAEHEKNKSKLVDE